MHKMPLFAITGLIGFSLLGATSAYAIPEDLDQFKKGNPNVVVFYKEGPHAIVGENEIHNGIDLVMKAGKSGNFQQWFWGTSESEGTHGEHSVWQETKDGKCPNNWTLVSKANPDWGSYFQPNTDYCVKTNDMSLTNNPNVK